MQKEFIVSAGEWFDGEAFHRQPTHFLVKNGKIDDIAHGDLAALVGDAELHLSAVPFLMPGMVDAHVHLFLDGAPTDLAERSAHMKKSVEDLMETARASARQSVAHGVSLVREAGDKHGINTAMKEEARQKGSSFLQVYNGGIAMRRPKRYGAFMAVNADTEEEILAVIEEHARLYDEVKLILTGIIDFETGTMTDDLQYSLDEVRLMVRAARTHGKRIFAHCSGIKGLEVAAEAGIGSVEHGFFMTESILHTMLENDVAWCPTFAPVHWQWANPEVMGWSKTSVSKLGEILDNHAVHLKKAHDMGVTLLMGTDAGSMGVEHGKAMLTEIQCFLDAGVPLEATLRAATSVPRCRFGFSAKLEKGSKFDAFGYAASPQSQLGALAKPLQGWISGFPVSG